MIKDTQEVAISIQNISKYFAPSAGQRSLKQVFANMFRKKDAKKDGYWALKDINFEIKKGEFFGIVGRNGSGKSTLLKMIAGVYTPTTGSIKVNGKLVPFIELGVGFNPELSGRDNVFLNGALLGFSRKEMEAMYDEIVEFAELKDHMDVKLKNFSSGMQVRLAFSIAIRAKSDILVIDEVLAVGDESFQRKCIDIFESYKAKGQTVVLVSHDMETVRRFCSRAILINDGLITSEGNANLVSASYSRLNAEVDELYLEESNNPIKVVLCDKAEKQRRKFTVGDNVHINISWPKRLEQVENVSVALIKNSGEYIYGTHTIGSGIVIKNNKITFDLKLSVGPGKYFIMAGLFGSNKYQVIKTLDRGPTLVVEELKSSNDHGLARLEYDWKHYD